MVMQQQITVGTLIAFMAVVNRLFQAIHILFSLRLQLYSLRASIIRIQELVGSEREPTTSTSEVNNSMMTDLTVESVTFEYDQKIIFDKISFNIPIGATCLVTGPNGAGKSTLMEVLAGLQVPISGKVTLGGRPLSEFPRELLRKNIAVVPQRPHIFDMTLLHNLVYSNELYEMTDVEKAMEIVGFKDDASRFTLKDLDSACGATSRMPSGGEVHRVALVRALLLRPKVLILDETFSSLPLNSEEEILSKLREFNTEMTIIVVSHRLSSLSNYSMIIKMNLAGKIECYDNSYNESKIIE